MIDADFMDLVWWVMAPLALAFALWAQRDCLRSDLLPPSSKLGFCILILLIPIWGGIMCLFRKLNPSSIPMIPSTAPDAPTPLLGVPRIKE